MPSCAPTWCTRASATPTERAQGEVTLRVQRIRPSIQAKSAAGRSDKVVMTAAGSALDQGIGAGVATACAAR